jgi:hypothetical protein
MAIFCQAYGADTIVMSSEDATFQLHELRSQAGLVYSDVTKMLEARGFDEDASDQMEQWSGDLAFQVRLLAEILGDLIDQAERIARRLESNETL